MITNRAAAYAAILVALVATFLVASPVRAQQGADDSVVIATPESLALLIELAPADTTIELAPGRYAPQRVSSKQRLTLRAQQPGTATITTNTYDDGKGLNIVDSNDITIDGITIERTKWGIAVLNSSNVIIENVTIRDVGQRGIWIHTASSEVSVLRSNIDRTGRRPGSRRDGSPYASMGEGIYVGNGSNPADDTNTIVIAGNTITNTTAEAVDVKVGTHGIDISSNVIRNVSARMGAIALHPGSIESNIGWARVSSNVVSNVAGTGIVVSASASVDANVVFDTDEHGIELRKITGDDTFVAFRNNTVFWTAGEDFRVAPHRRGLTVPMRWGNGGREHLPGFPDGWLADDTPTPALWQHLAELRAETGDDLPIRETAPSVHVGNDAPPATTTSTTAAPVAPASSQVPTSVPSEQFPIYDTAWQMLVRSTPQQTDNYFSTLSEYGFTGSWAAIIHHAPATYLHRHASGGQVGRYENGEIILNNGYIAHVRSILDTAERHDQKVGLIAAWQNTYLPGGNSGADELSNRVEGTLTTRNAYAYGRQIADAFGDHPAVSSWVFGGDAGTNNTDANKAVWREMARALDDAGMTQPIGYHTPTIHFDQLNYAGEPWLDYIAPETGHNQGPGETESQLRAAVAAFNVPVWQGESRYFGINFSSWIKPEFTNPGRDEVVADALAAQRAGVGGYVYGDAGRWAWCLFQNGNGDASPCDPNNIGASFGQAERDIVRALR